MFVFKAKQFNLYLIENQKPFINVSLTDFHLTTTSYENTIVHYDGHLSGMNFTNLRSENWRKLISVPRGGKAVKFKYTAYPKSIGAVIGYDSSLSVDFCTMEFVYFQETTNHLWNYLLEYFGICFFIFLIH